jgi:hypothetical protein
MLEKMLGLGSFGTTLGHLARHQITIFASSGGLSLPLMAKPSLSGLMCCPYLFRMLDFDHVSNSFSFLTK